MYNHIVRSYNLGQYKPNAFVDGVILTSPLGHRAIAALEHETLLIAKVPLDQREYCRSQLVQSLKRPGRDTRFDLLCTVAHPGSGKTIIQNFNASWFKNETKGIAVVITFNDDQNGLFKTGSIRSVKEFHQSLAVRIMHRVMQHFTDADTADIALEVDGPIVQAIVALDKPLESSLRLLRRCFGAPADTKVLLCVDEIAKANTDTTEHIRAKRRLGDFNTLPTLHSAFRHRLQISCMYHNKVVDSG